MVCRWVYGISLRSTPCKSPAHFVAYATLLRGKFAGGITVEFLAEVELIMAPNEGHRLRLYMTSKDGAIRSQLNQGTGGFNHWTAEPDISDAWLEAHH